MANCDPIKKQLDDATASRDRLWDDVRGHRPKKGDEAWRRLILQIAQLNEQIEELRRDFEACKAANAGGGSALHPFGTVLVGTVTVVTASSLIQPFTAPISVPFLFDPALNVLTQTLPASSGPFTWSGGLAPGTGRITLERDGAGSFSDGSKDIASLETKCTISFFGVRRGPFGVAIPMNYHIESSPVLATTNQGGSPIDGNGLAVLVGSSDAKFRFPPPPPELWSSGSVSTTLRGTFTVVP